MRRRRKPLEVSTFPFLAVLLCAMGSLIFVLLVMDRKAKSGVRAKAQADITRTVKNAEQAAAQRRADLERQSQEMRAEWEKKRDALHTKLLTEQQALQLEMQQLHEKILQAAARLRLEQEQACELKKQVETEQGKEQGEAAALAATKKALTDSENHTKDEKAALVRMTNDLVILEQAIRDLKEARERERQTYSIVPYNGKRGESRKPIYIECTRDSVIFHPDKKSLHVGLEVEAVRKEVARRFGRQCAQLAAAKLPVDPAPYLMLLVRPDGIHSYYAFQEAFAGLDVQYGYELIDADWLLDIPAENQPGTQPWQALAKTPDGAPLPPLAVTNDEAKVHGVRFGMKPGSTSFGPATDVANTSGAGNSQATLEGKSGIGTPGDGSQRLGTASGVPWSTNGPGPSGAGGDGSGTIDRSEGNSDQDFSLPEKLPLEILASGSPLSNPHSRSPNQKSDGSLPPPSSIEQITNPLLVSGGAEEMPGHANGNHGGTSENTSGTGPSSQQIAQGNNTPDPTSVGPILGNENGPPGSGPGGAPGQQSAQSTSSGQGPANGAGPGNGGEPGGRQGSEAVPKNSPPSGNVDPENKPRPPSLGTPTVAGAATGSAGSPGEPGDSGSENEPEAILRPLPPVDKDNKRPPPVVHAARLNGNRDYVIFIECKKASVVLYPSQTEYPLASLVGGPNDPLAPAVKQMIERKQSGVQPGELPFRPQVRFLVRPDTMRAYHDAYPVFEGLPLTKSRQDLIPEDDVRKIVGGN